MFDCFFIALALREKPRKIISLGSFFSKIAMEWCRSLGSSQISDKINDQ